MARMPLAPAGFPLIQAREEFLPIPGVADLLRLDREQALLKRSSLCRVYLPCCGRLAHLTSTP